ncbi:low choriolytic enzyme-like [Scomber japonicus]|uniref:low choriolytic enzyme-like n=1 Tax=Scomber japonicus TaxID=13676 RepID=UPI0023061AD6|nr:low choriolytic enzyme-like [Scomber japonicus]
MDLKTMISLLLLLLVGLCKAHPANEHEADSELSVETSTEDMSTTILRMNNGTDFLLEGDLEIPKTRNAMKCFNKEYSCLWPKSANGNVEVPFTISEKYDNNERNEILNAMRGFATKTCIRFVRRRNERAYIRIEPRFGCASLLGRVGDLQTLSLQRFGCVSYGIIQHELMHALGFYHEHTRPDRDQYIKIHWENVLEHLTFNFKKKDSNTLNLRYDYTSVMHYGRNYFGKRGSETITPILDPNAPIGKAKSLSAFDIHKINLLYKCWNYIG